MRGKAPLNAVFIHKYRITPAYAGKRREPLKEGDTVQDHPRLCGEKFTFLIDTVFPARITPAYAGKSWRCWRN